MVGMVDEIAQAEIAKLQGHKSALTEIVKELLDEAIVERDSYYEASTIDGRYDDQEDARTVDLMTRKIQRMEAVLRQTAA